MKKVMLSFSALLAITIAVVSWKSRLDERHGAIHLSGGKCQFVGTKNTTGDPNSNPPTYIIGTYKYVESPNGQATLTCKGQTKNSTGRAYKITPEDWSQPCYINGVTKGGQEGKTDDWQVTVSASGQATAVCHWSHKD